MNHWLVMPIILPAMLLTRHALDQPAHWTRFVPPIALALVLFGMEPLSMVAATTGVQAGVLLILFAMVLVLRSRWTEPSTSADRTKFRGQVA